MINIIALSVSVIKCLFGSPGKKSVMVLNTTQEVTEERELYSHSKECYIAIQFMICTMKG